MRASALTCALLLTLAGAASAQEKKPRRRAAPKPAADPAAAPAKAASPAPKATIEDADRSLQALASAQEAFRICVEGWQWLNQDLAAAVARAGKPSDAPVQTSSGASAGGKPISEVVVIKKSRLEAQRASCAAKLNDAGSRVSMASSAIAQLQPPTGPAADARRAQFAGLEDAYVAACAKFGAAVKKIGVPSASPLSGPGNAPKRTGFSRF